MQATQGTPSLSSRPARRTQIFASAFSPLVTLPPVCPSMTPQSQPGVSESTVYAAMRRFQREGIAAFRNKRSAGCRVRLTSDLLGAVAAFVRANPVAGLDALGRIRRALPVLRRPIPACHGRTPSERPVREGGDGHPKGFRFERARRSAGSGTKTWYFEQNTLYRRSCSS